jgi:hypothetical protein
MAAASTVPFFQKWEVRTAATPDATAAMTRVCSDRPSFPFRDCDSAMPTPYKRCRETD